MVAVLTPVQQALLAKLRLGQTLVCRQAPVKKGSMRKRLVWYLQPGGAKVRGDTAASLVRRELLEQGPITRDGQKMLREFRLVS